MLAGVYSTGAGAVKLSWHLGTALSIRKRQGAGILLPLHQDVVAIAAQVGPLLATAVGPHNLEAIDAFRLAEPEDVPAIGGRSVAAAALGEAGLRAAAGLDGDARAHDVGVIGAAQLDAQPMVARPADVAQYRDRLVDVADHDVDGTVVIEITEAGAAGQVRLAEILAAPR